MYFYSTLVLGVSTIRRIPCPVGLLLRRVHRQLCLERRPPCCRRPSRRPTDVVTVPPPTTVVGIPVSPSSTAGTTTMSAVPGSSSVVAAPAVPATLPVVVVHQLQVVRPYNVSTSWKLFRDHFNRFTKVNSWTTNDDLVHLTLSLEGAAAEVLRDFDDTSSAALSDLWSRLEHRFGEGDGCMMPCASLRPDV